MSNKGNNRMRSNADFSLGTRVKSIGMSLDEFKAKLPVKAVIKAEELVATQKIVSTIPNTCQACGQTLKR